MTVEVILGCFMAAVIGICLFCCASRETQKQIIMGIIMGAMIAFMIWFAI